jgi:radical SAM protein with 4Fe4S-binding SPASM domain
MNLDQPMDLIFQKRIPWRAVFEITNACQLNCIHCFHQDHVKKDELSTDIILRTIRDLRDLGTMQLTITGGEATMRSDVCEIIEAAINDGMNVQLQSNGQIEKSKLTKFCNFKTKFSIEISLLGDQKANDAITGQQGSYEKALDTIKILSKNSIKVRINTIVMQQNYESLMNLSDVCKRLNVGWQHSPMIYDDKNGNYRLNDEQLLEYYKSFTDEIKLMSRLKYIKKEAVNYAKNCNAGHTTILIDCRGNVYPCAWLRELLGNIKNDTLHNIWFNNEKLKQSLNEEKIGCSRCLECKYYPVCKRCPGYAYAETGKYDECPLEWCRHMKIQEKAVRGLVV